VGGCVASVCCACGRTFSLTFNFHLPRVSLFCTTACMHGKPSEVADAVLFLATATWCSGAIIDVNGASYLRS
jgi:NAD(P)-dependent dehydrogenase (short-subunit alcohol dehydrogenase family)